MYIARHVYIYECIYEDRQKCINICMCICMYICWQTCMSLYVCMYVCMYVWGHACIYISHVNIYVSRQMCIMYWVHQCIYVVCMYIFMYVGRHVYRYVYSMTGMRMYMCICVYKCKQTCTSLSQCIYVFMHICKLFVMWHKTATYILGCHMLDCIMNEFIVAQIVSK